MPDGDEATSARVDGAALRVAADSEAHRTTDEADERPARRSDAARAARAGVPTARARSGSATSVRPGHHAAAVAATIVSSIGPPPTIQRGTLQRVDAVADGLPHLGSDRDPSRPRRAPRRSLPRRLRSRRPSASIARRRCFSFAPTAAIIPSCGSRRCAMTVKLDCCDERDEHEHERADDEREDCRDDVLGIGRRATRRCVRCRPAAGTDRRAPRSRSRASSRTSTARVADGGSSANSSPRSLGFSTVPTTVRFTPSRSIVEPTVHAERVDDAVGHRDLVVGDRIATRAQAQHRLAEGTVGLLRPIVDLLDRARQRHADGGRSRRSAPNHCFARVELGLQRRGSRIV